MKKKRWGEPGLTLIGDIILQPYKTLRLQVCRDTGFMPPAIIISFFRRDIFRKPGNPQEDPESIDSFHFPESQLSELIALLQKAQDFEEEKGGLPRV